MHDFSEFKDARRALALFWSVAVIQLGSFSNTAATLLSEFSITDLGGQKGDRGLQSIAINNSGEIILSYMNGGPSSTYASGAFTPLGDLGGGETYATAMNNRDQVVGISHTATGTQTAFIYQNGQMSELGNGQLWSAVGINDRGQVAAFTTTGLAALSDAGNITTLGTLGGRSSTPGGINNLGQVVGSADLPSPPNTTVEHPFLYSGGVMKDLGTLGGDRGDATAINDRGQIVGQSAVGPSPFWHAFLYSDGVMRDLGTLDGDFSYAYAINEDGQIVGTAGKAGSNAHAFVVSGDAMIDLNTTIPAASGWELTAATDINDSGQIIGVGLLNGQEHAFVLTPRPVPDRGASAMQLLLAGVIFLEGFRRTGRYQDVL